MKTLREINDCLGKLGHMPILNDDHIVLPIGGSDNPFTSVLNIDDGKLKIVCQLATFGQIGEDKFGEFSTLALDLNSVIVPYAIALITGSATGDEEDNILESPVVLIDTVPLSDLSECELQSSIHSLLGALIEVSPLVKSSVAAAV